MLRRSSLVLAMFTAALLSSASVADAQVRFGLRAGEYTDVSEPFLGAELIMPIAPAWYFNPNVEVVFADRGDLATLNGDFVRHFGTGTRTTIWAGGGLAVVFEDFDDRNEGDSDTNVGGNVIVGAGWRLREVTPYVQVKGLLGDRDDFVVMGGIRF